ncbi:protein fem-1 homolog CG6966 isoform X3 [Chrysoperla carnea]|uniref:protein fem-1 homolog CG6966 isoform X3 n=1 Tax=Chrysoperla carnea TaxID=189513 RepID=UPI001D067590|nr:protein fem-1 homolog CG6966 isoform X3 [Chrysoperla carnea]
MSKKMSLTHHNKTDMLSRKDICFADLIEECKYGAPGATLSNNLRIRLERFPIFVRREIVSRLKDGCAPLFIACKRGQVEVVEYLIEVCNADVEQRGLYEVPDDRSVHCVTPLWCASVSGRLPVLRVLIAHGAQINAVSDTGSTPVRSACFMTNLDVVYYLVENGADVNKANYNGGTCLINSVQSAHLCEFLLENGADVNARDIQNKTALHYAIQEHRLETTILLIKYGADCHAKARVNDDALQLACLKGANRIFEYLVTTIDYSYEKLANAYELMGSTYLDEYNDIFSALWHWNYAAEIRENHPEEKLLPKRPVIPTRAAFRHQKEFESVADLREVETDLDSMRIQSLLICERILGCYHKDGLFRLMFRGAAYAEALRYQRCVDLWRRALEIRVEKDDCILSGDTCFTAQALVRLMVDLNEKKLQEYENVDQRFDDIVETFLLLTNDITGARKLLEIRPVSKRQMEGFDRILKCVTHLIYLMMETANTPEQVQRMKELVTDLVKKNPRSASTDDTLLHLCVSKLNTIKSSYFPDEILVIFPKLKVIKLLLECGAAVNAVNESKSTPLHIATLQYNFDSALIQLLLDNGGHIDMPNRLGNIPRKAIVANSNSNINLVNYITLKCLAASTVTKYKIPYKNQIPKTLETFVTFH